jgi:hypothetical protein
MTIIKDMTGREPAYPTASFEELRKKDHEVNVLRPFDAVARAALQTQAQIDELRLKRWAKPFLQKGYRFDELTAMRTHPPEYKLYALGIQKELPRWVLTLRVWWRQWFRYGAADLWVGGEKSWRKKL